MEYAGKICGHKEVILLFVAANASIKLHLSDISWLSNRFNGYNRSRLRWIRTLLWSAALKNLL